MGDANDFRFRVFPLTSAEAGLCDMVYEALAKPGADDQRRIAVVFLRALRLCLAKNADYGSSFRRSPRLAPNVTAQEAVLVRIEDKESRFANLAEGGSDGAVGESRLDTMRDSANYRLLWCLLEEERLEAGAGSVEPLPRFQCPAVAPSDLQGGAVATADLAGTEEEISRQEEELFSGWRRRARGLHGLSVIGGPTEGNRARTALVDEIHADVSRRHPLGLAQELNRVIELLACGEYDADQQAASCLLSLATAESSGASQGFVALSRHRPGDAVDDDAEPEGCDPEPKEA